MIKAIIFDCGNVLCKFDNNIFLEKVATNSDKSVEELKEIIYGCGLSNRFERGEISSEEFFKTIKSKTGFNLGQEKFAEFFTNIFTPNVELIDLIKKLKEHYKIALLSNTNELDFKSNYGNIINFWDLFDVKTLSYELGAMKPDEKIFLDVLNKLNLSPEECIFVDDMKENVEAAKKIGFNSVQFFSNTQLTDFFDELGIFAFNKI